MLMASKQHQTEINELKSISSNNEAILKSLFFFLFPSLSGVTEMETADGIGGLSALCISFALREIMIEP